MKTQKDRLIAADIKDRIFTGVLKAGGKLPANPLLLKEYGVGQSVISRALDSLAAEKIIDRRNRSGCYISEDALQIISDIRKNESHFEFESSAKHKVSIFEFTPSRLQKTLSLFTPDCQPVKSGLWKEALQEFCDLNPGVKINLHIADRGMFDPSLDFQNFDLIHGIPALLKHIGPETFHPLKNLATVGLKEEDLIAPFVPLAATTGNPYLIPFSIVPTVLMVNINIEKKFKLPKAEACRSFTEMIAMLRQAVISGQLPARIGFELGSLCVMLACEGLIHLDRAGKYRLDLKKTGEFVTLLHSLYSLRKPHLTPEANPCRVDETWMQVMYTYVNEVLASDKHLRYRIAPLPLSEGGSVFVTPMVLGIKSQQRHLPECIELARFLCNEKNQRRFCAAGDSIPSRAKLLSEPDTMKPTGLSPDELRTLVARSSILYGEHEQGASLMDKLYRLGLEMIDGTQTPEEIKSRIESL